MFAFNESRLREDLFPITLTRPVASIRVGILTIREKWEHSGLAIADAIDPNIIPSKAFFKEIAATGYTSALQKKELYRTFRYPWDLPALNAWAISQDLELVKGEGVSAPIPETVRVTGNSSDVFIEPGATLENCFFNTTDGPIYIGSGATIMDGAMLRGPVAIGNGAVVKMGAAIYGATTIGPHCVIGGEVKNSIFIGYSNKGHDGYIGDAVIGEWCNLGAGTSCSNLRNTASEVKVWHMRSGTFINGGLKCGLIMGDHSLSSINSSFNTASVVGVAANIFQPGVLLPKYIPSFSWGTGNGERYRLEKALDDISNWMRFKQAELTKEKIDTLTEIYNNQP